MQQALKFNIRNQNIQRVDSFLPVRNSRNYLYAEFDFKTCDWAGITKTALFKGEGKEPIAVILGETDTCLVPWEVLEYSSFTVSVYGGNLITVDSAPIKLYESGYKSGDIPDPTETVYEQVMNKFDETRQYTAEQAELSKRYAVGSLSYPGSETDNSKYYAEQAAANAAETERDRQEVETLVVQLDEVRQDMALTEEYKNQAAASAANALMSETNAKASEAAAAQSASDAQAAENSAAQWAEETSQNKEDTQALAEQVASDKAEISAMKSSVDASKESVDNTKENIDSTVSAFNLTVQDAISGVNVAGNTQIGNITDEGNTQVQRVQAAGNAAVSNIGIKENEALDSVEEAKKCFCIQY